MMRAKIAGLLQALARRIEPGTSRTINVTITSESVEALAAALNGELGGKIGLGYTRPDGSSGWTARY